MTKERAYFEAVALRKHGLLCPNHVPDVYHFDRTMSLIGMRYLEPPHIILRKGLIAGIEYPLLADHVSEYMAKTLFGTSILYNSTTVHKESGTSMFLLAYEDVFSYHLKKKRQGYLACILHMCSCRVLWECGAMQAH